MNIPVDLNAAQQARLKALLMRGDPNLFVISQKVEGQEVYVLVAVGAARDWVVATLTPDAEATAVPEPEPLQPPVKKVAVSTGERTANPSTAERPTPSPRGLSS